MTAPTNLYIDGKLASWFFRLHQPAQAAASSLQLVILEKATGEKQSFKSKYMYLVEKK
jgi:hypothetical protein